jgi:FKBP-type peptidyl-prolyl cis-trans isomerase
MKTIWVAVVCAGLLTSRGSAAEPARKTQDPARETHDPARETHDPAPKTQKQKASYAMGVAVARTLQRQGVEVDVDVYARGLRDALAGQPLAFTDEELRVALAGTLAGVKAKQAGAGKDRKAAGDAFFAENGKKEGVVRLPSGVQYKVLEAGKGKRPTDADAIECDYRGTLLDGKEFDSSRKRGKPATLQVSRLIPGFREAVKLMPVGSRWQVWIPPELGYGARGGGRKSRIGPNEPLAFEIRLLGIGSGDAAVVKTASAPE